MDVSPVQVGGQRMQFAACVRERRLTNLKRDNSAALRAKLQPIELDSYAAQAFVGIVQTLQRVGMMPLIEPSGAHEQMQASQGAIDLRHIGVIQRLAPSTRYGVDHWSVGNGEVGIRRGPASLLVY